jgi:hypothetical protein
MAAREAGIATQPPDRAAMAEARTRISGDPLAFVVTSMLLLAMYLPLQNPYWVPGGDSEVYTAIARNLATGRGYTFNGQPVSMVPPGWPLLLAGAMKVSPSFLFLKLLNMSCMFGSLLMGYWICRRFASPALSALVIVLTAVLSHVYALTFWLHSDALFCLTSSAVLLLAMQINEGKPHSWRIPLLVAMCSASVFVRWAGLFSWLLAAAALVNGQLRPRWNRCWMTLIISAAVTASTFYGLRWYLTVPPEINSMVKSWATDDPSGGAALSDKTLAQSYSIFDPGGEGLGRLVGRAGYWGQWVAYLLWQPLRLGFSNALVALIALAVGWVVLIPLIVQGYRSTLRCEWLWPAMLLYALVLAMNWPRPNARYYVPIASLVILGVFKGVQIIRDRFATPSVLSSCKVLLGYFAAFILLCNGVLYAVDLSVARSHKFYETYEAGLNRDLIYACHWLNERPDVGDGQIAVSEYYVNLGRPRISRLGLRATTMLTGKAIVSVPKKYTISGDPRGSEAFLRWARKLGIKYVLYQPVVSPWRVFHFRMGWLQEAMTDAPATDTGAGWRLYAIPPEGQGNEAVRISVPPADRWLSRVPGV